LTEFPPASTQSLMSFWEFKKAVFTFLKHKYRGLAIDGFPSIVYEVIGLYGVCGQVGAERESLSSSWELRKEQSK
jgi:hypothetical protein